MLLRMCRASLERCSYPPREWAPEDVRQALFMRILEAPWKVERAPLGGWLTVLIRHLVADAMKSAYGRRTENIPAHDDENSKFLDRSSVEGAWPPPATLAELHELREGLLAALAALPFEDRQIVTLRFVAGHTLQEISEELGIALTTTHRKIERAVDRLREELTPLWPQERSRPGAKP